MKRRKRKGWTPEQLANDRRWNMDGGHIPKQHDNITRHYEPGPMEDWFLLCSERLRRANHA